jgi:hypothetical protein
VLWFTAAVWFYLSTEFVVRVLLILRITLCESWSRAPHASSLRAEGSAVRSGSSAHAVKVSSPNDSARYKSSTYAGKQPDEIAILPRRLEYLLARALQIRAELGPHIHGEPGFHDPHTVSRVTERESRSPSQSRRRESV